MLGILRRYFKKFPHFFLIFFYVLDIRRILLFNILSFLLVTLSQAICKLLDASGRKVFGCLWSHSSLFSPGHHPQIDDLLEHSWWVQTDGNRKAPDLHCGQGAQELTQFGIWMVLMVRCVIWWHVLSCNKTTSCDNLPLHFVQMASPNSFLSMLQ